MFESVGVAFYPLLPLPVDRGIQSKFCGCLIVVATSRLTPLCERSGVGVVWFEC